MILLTLFSLRCCFTREVILLFVILLFLILNGSVCLRFGSGFSLMTMYFCGRNIFLLVTFTIFLLLVLEFEYIYLVICFCIRRLFLQLLSRLIFTLDLETFHISQEHCSAHTMPLLERRFLKIVQFRSFLSVIRSFFSLLFKNI